MVSNIYLIIFERDFHKMDKTLYKKKPPGRIKIVQALQELLEEKDFNAITTFEIATKASVTEGLIYKYFKNKRDLLYETLAESFETFIQQTNQRIEKETKAIDKIKGLVYAYLFNYSTDKVMARILLLEVRNSKDFYESKAYSLVQEHSLSVLNIIEQGMINNEITKNINASIIRSSLFGAIEHACLPCILFDRNINVEDKTADICEMIFNGIKV